MSGGHYEYKYSQIEYLAEEIDREFENEGKYMTEDWSIPTQLHFNKRPMVEEDHFSDATEEEKKFLLNEIKGLVADLKDVAFRAKELEWFMSGDTGCDSYTQRLKKYYNELGD